MRAPMLLSNFSAGVFYMRDYFMLMTGPVVQFNPARSWGLIYSARVSAGNVIRPLHSAAVMAPMECRMT
jgi:hypothetical protein